MVGHRNHRRPRTGNHGAALRSAAACVIPASRGGKLKTLVQTVAIGVYLLPLPDAVGPFATALILLAVVLTVVTGLDYVVQAARLRAGVRRAEQEHRNGEPT